jgi:hypothetical protein
LIEALQKARAGEIIESIALDLVTPPSLLSHIETEVIIPEEEEDTTESALASTDVVEPGIPMTRSAEVITLPCLPDVDSQPATAARIAVFEAESVFDELAAKGERTLPKRAQSVDFFGRPSQKIFDAPAIDFGAPPKSLSEGAHLDAGGERKTSEDVTEETDPQRKPGQPLFADVDLPPGSLETELDRGAGAGSPEAELDRRAGAKPKKAGTGRGGKKKPAKKASLLDSI